MDVIPRLLPVRRTDPIVINTALPFEPPQIPLTPEQEND